MAGRLTVPESFRAYWLWQHQSEDERRWLADLPDLVAASCDRWGLVVDGEPMHGAWGLAVPVSRDGQPLILKVAWPNDLLAMQVRALRVWAGRGTVLLLDAAPAAGALLLERLDASRSLVDLPLTEAVPIVGRQLRRLAVPAPDGSSDAFGTTWDAAVELHESLRQRWEAIGRPFSSRVLDLAVGLASELTTDRPAVMVDRDLHYDHVLAGVREPWLAVDSWPLVGSIEYQTAQLLWTRYDEIAAEGRLHWCLDALVDAAGLDPDRARDWAVLRSVDYWLWGLDAGFTEDPIRCQGIVDQLGS
jgi:streptomycin 6-kinase